MCKNVRGSEGRVKAQWGKMGFGKAAEVKPEFSVQMSLTEWRKPVTKS